MLVLSRKPTEAIVINDETTVTVVGVNGNKVRLGIEAPKDVRVDRLEVHKRRTDEPPQLNGKKSRLPPKVESTINVKIVTFTAGQIRNVTNVVAEEINGHANDLGECHLLLDFTNVTLITSEEIGTLVGLHKKMRSTGGKLTLFNLSADVFEVFSICRIEKLIGICR